jgi:hypothetical protein
MKEDYEKTFKWITKLLNKHKFRFHFHGGLAAYAYGSKLRHNDIDLDMNFDDMQKLSSIAKQYIVEELQSGTSPNKIWKGCLLVLKFRGIKIDITEARDTKIFNKITNEYESFPTDIENPTFKEIFGLSVPIMPLKNLIDYKSKLRFPNDLIDLKYLNEQNTN